MANSTISISFKVEDAGDFKKLSANADEFKNVIRSAVTESDNLHKNIINWAQASQAIQTMQSAVQGILNVTKNLTDAYAEQEVNETKLATVMRERMGATDDMIQSVLAISIGVACA